MLTLHPIPAFTDNYIWCLHDSSIAYVVDPGQAEPVLAYLQDNELELKGVLITHYHWDHVSGIDALLKAYPSIPVWGPSAEVFSGKTQDLGGGDEVELAWGLRFQVLALPGHTLGHIAYYSADTELGPLLFCGDTLFSSGCGRLFEGTPEQMHHSLQRLVALPAKTIVCCTHEYTSANLAFAQAVEPSNADVLARADEVARLRGQNLPSLPTSMALEMKVNPFLRVEQPSVISAISKKCGGRPASNEETFAKLRQWKDSF
jgi:hydroxyacylglutathione hydrolase